MRQNRVVLGLALLAAAAALAAQVDPFYLKALSDGERLFAAGDDANAALSLEIAVFGLQNDKANLSKALAYFILSAYRSGQVEKSRDAARRLTGLTGRDGLTGISLGEDWKADLIKLVEYFEVTPPGSEQPSGGQTRTLDQPRQEARSREAVREKEGPTDLDKARLADLEKKVKDEPGNAQAWLDLHNLRSRLGDSRGAKRALQRLVEEAPREPRGRFLLGKALYLERKFKEAVLNLEEALALIEEKDAGGALALSSLGYGILAWNFMGRRDETREKCLLFVNRAGEGWRAALDMGDRDRSILENILAPYFQGGKNEDAAAFQSANPPPPEAAPSAERKTESRSRAQLDAAARAYGMFDQYLQEGNAASARRTLERLLRQDPSETRAVHLLAGLDFRQRKFEDSRDRFQAVVKEARQSGDREGLLAEAAAYLVLCARQLKGDEAARALAEAYRRDLEGAALDGLGLDGADKQLIRDFLAGAPGQAATERTLEKVLVQDSGEELRIEVVYTPKTTFRAFVLENDRKIVIDLFNVTRILSERVLPVMRRGVQTVRTGLFQENTARIVLDVHGGIPAYTVRETETGLLILIR